MNADSFESRLQRLEDIEEIKQIQSRYINCVLVNDWDGVSECFSEDGTFDAHAGSVTGRKELNKFFREVVGANHIGKENFSVIHPIIEVDGDTARGSWLLTITFAKPRKLKIKMAEMPTDDAPDWLHGFYENEYVRENGKWKIRYLKFRNRLTSPMTG